MNNQEQKSAPEQTPEQTSEQPIVPQEPIKKPKPKWLIPVIIIIILLIIGGGVYCWWNYFKVFKEPEIPISLIEADKTEIIEVKQGEENILFEKLKEKTAQYQEPGTFQRILIKKIDQKKEQFLSLDEFFKILGISIPTNILNNLGEKYTLFIYSQKEWNNEGNRLGIVIEVNPIDKLTEQIKEQRKSGPMAEIEHPFYVMSKEWEETMIKDLKPLFLEESIGEPATEEFQDYIVYYGEAGGPDIRYLDLPEPELSINYSYTYSCDNVPSSCLLIATSRETIFKTIDNLIMTTPSNWKTYKDEVYLFSFEMPSNWSGGPTRQEPGWIFESPYFLPGAAPGAEFYIYPKKDNVSKNLSIEELEEIVKTDSWRREISSLTPITFSNHKALLVKRRPAYKDVYEGGIKTQTIEIPTQQEDIIVQNNDILWEITYEIWSQTDDKQHFWAWPKDKDHFWNIVQKILSSFTLFESDLDVVLIEPAHESTVERIDSIKVTFNTALDPRTINTDNFYIPEGPIGEISGKISYDKDKFQIIFTPDQPVVAQSVTDKDFIYLIIKGGTEGVKDKNGKPFIGFKMYRIDLLKDITANILNIQSIKMTISDKWNIDRQTENQVYIKTDYQPYNVFLVLNVKKNNEYDIKWYKDERNGGDYTKIRNGEIFKITCGGALACNGAIVNNDVYTFNWDIKGDQPMPEDLDGIWMPDHNVAQEDIWNMLLSIEK